MTSRLDGKPIAIQREIERIDSGGDAWSEDDEVVQIEFKRPLDKVVPVRLASEHWYRLYHEARELGVGPTTLARMWILEKLRTLPARPAPDVARTPAPKHAQRKTRATPTARPAAARSKRTPAQPPAASRPKPAARPSRPSKRPASKRRTP